MSPSVVSLKPRLLGRLLAPSAAWPSPASSGLGAPPQGAGAGGPLDQRSSHWTLYMPISITWELVRNADSQAPPQA